jgi:hypothetical protein
MTMPSGTKKSKCAFRKVLALEPVSASDSNCAERILARFVALAYAADYPILFTPGTDEALNGTHSLSELSSSDTNDFNDRSRKI